MYVPIPAMLKMKDESNTSKGEGGGYIFPTCMQDIFHECGVLLGLSVLTKSYLCSFPVDFLMGGLSN